MHPIEMQCNICEKIIKSKPANLRRHKRLHEPYERYKCSKCTQTCGNKFNFKVHCSRIHKIEDEEEAMSIATIVMGNSKGIVYVW